MSTNITVSPCFQETLGVFYHDAQAELLTKLAAFGYKDVTINIKPNKEPNVINVDDGSFFLASFESVGCVDGVAYIDLKLTRR